MGVGRSTRHRVAAVAGLALAMAASAQFTQPTRETPNAYPSTLPPRKGPPPPHVALRVDLEIPLPSLRDRSALRPASGGVLFESDGGPLEVPVVAGASAAAPATPPEPKPDPTVWVLSADGRHRVRTLPEGRVEAERRGRRASSKWHRAWTLRVPGRTPAPPSIQGERVFFGSVDCQVYCVRLDNGHRVWAVDLGDRITLPLAAGRFVLPSPAGTRAKSDPLDFVLGIPDGGSSLVALDAYDGSKIAAYEAGRSEMLVTAPIVLADGRVAVGRAGYSSGGASLVVLRLESDAEPAKSGQN